MQKVQQQEYVEPLCLAQVLKVQPQLSSHLVLDIVSHNFAIEEHVRIDSLVVASGSSQLFPVQVQKDQQHLQDPLVLYYLDDQS